MATSQEAVKKVSHLLAALLGGLLLVHIVYPSIAIDPTALGLLVLLIIVLVLPYSKAIKFPGGGGIELDLHEAQRAVALAEAQPRVQPRRIAPTGELKPLGELNLRRISADEQRAWRYYIAEDSGFALAGLRLEIERLLRILARIETGSEQQRLTGIGQLLDFLRGKEVLSPEDVDAVNRVVQVCNRAIHAENVPREVAFATADLGDRVLALLDSKLPPPRD